MAPFLADRSTLIIKRNSSRYVKVKPPGFLSAWTRWTRSNDNILRKKLFWQLELRRYLAALDSTDLFLVRH